MANPPVSPQLRLEYAKIGYWIFLLGTVCTMLLAGVRHPRTAICFGVLAAINGIACLWNRRQIPSWGGWMLTVGALVITFWAVAHTDAE